jgi:hypothetical protein
MDVVDTVGVPPDLDPSMQPLPPNPYQSPNAPVAPLVEKPNNNLILAIFATLCCCVPSGIAAIVYAAQVDSKWSSGDYAGAQHSADESKKWSYISIGLGLVFSVIYFAMGLSGAGGDY